MNNSKFQIPNSKFSIFIEELFYALTISLVVFGFLEAVWPRLVLAYININYVLLIWLLNGIILLRMKAK